MKSDTSLPYGGGLYTEEQARQIARKIFYSYDRNRNEKLDDYEISSMMMNNYKNINKQFAPNPNDLSQYKEVLDTDGDGLITVNDFENLCMRFFSGVQTPIRRSVQLQKASQPQTATKGNMQTSTRIVFPELEAQNGRKYTTAAQERLELARRLFKMFDSDNSGYITESEVRGLLIETYRQVNMVYNPTESDIKAWMQMTDTNHDGMVSLEEFENLVIKSLQHSGEKVFE